MIITLLIPDLIPPPEMRDAALGGLALPALQTLLARADKTTAPAEGGLDGWLCHAFGIDKQQDWPIAPVTLLADGGEPGKDYWLRADPVHLRATRDKLMLVDSGAFQLTQTEAETYAQAFNAHFSADGFTLYPLRPDRWYLKLDQHPALITQPVTAVTGKHLDPYLPQGADGLKWHRPVQRNPDAVFQPASERRPRGARRVDGEQHLAVGRRHSASDQAYRRNQTVGERPHRARHRTCRCLRPTKTFRTMPPP